MEKGKENPITEYTEITAVHEAGHCFAAYHFGVAIHCVGLGNTKLSKDVKLSEEQNCVLCMAGVAAEIVFFGKPVPQSASKDRHDCVKHFPGGLDNMEKYGRVDQYMEKAKRLIVQNHHIVNVIREKLRDEKCLCGEEVAFIVESARRET